MRDEQKKNDIRRRITLMRYPRRSTAQFTDENDHNPLVLQDCPTCNGRGKVSEYEDRAEDCIQVHCLVQCTACGGSGITGQVEPYFAEDWPEVETSADTEGWLTCPRCRWRFTTRDPRAWTGRRHLRCGQKIKVTSEKN